jgi:CAAX prenyl protease-like protein
MKLSHWKHSPVAVRVLPFAVFVAITLLQDRFGESARYWLYLAKTLAGAWFLFQMRGYVQEMRWKFSPEAFVAGVGVFIIWVGLPGFFKLLGLDPGLGDLKMGSGRAWNPLAQFGEASVLAWFFVMVRILGSGLVVPPLEEVFFRSFIYRYLAKKDFLSVPLGKYIAMPFFVTAIIFGLEHREWLAGILAGLIYGGLVIWKKRLRDAIVAHAVTNLLLGLWVVWRGAYQFW